MQIQVLLEAKHQGLLADSKTLLQNQEYRNYFQPGGEEECEYKFYVIFSELFSLLNLHFYQNPI